ncbi:MBL fold metallo-hydrolase [Gammaproteobacteria bacterium]|nr:MBL fold metallo-hydrolase [Gammaproteobacteria bacterium]
METHTVNMRTLSRNFCIVLAPALTSALAVAAERGPAVPDYPVDEITDRVYVIHGPLDTPNPVNQGFMNNPGMVITDEGVVVLDPGGSVQSGEMVLRAAAGLTDKPVVAVFNSHVHGDHWLGNQAIRASYPDVPIYGHPNMIALAGNGEGRAWIELAEKLTGMKIAGTEVVPPDQAVKHGDEIRIGGTTFRIHHYEPAHTTSDIMVEVVEAGVVFLGDNVLIGRIPRMEEGDVAGNIKACDEIVRSGAKFYVPGHGKTGDRSVVDTMRTYLDTLYVTVKKLYADGLSDFEMKEEVSRKLQAYSGWNEFDVQLGKHISLAYLQIEADDF